MPYVIEARIAARSRMSQHVFCPSKSHTALSLAGSLEVQDKENNEQGYAAAEVSVKIQQT